MTATWIRSHYGVPAYRGGRVAITLGPDGRQIGTIVGFLDLELRVRFDLTSGGSFTATVHPTRGGVEYLPRAEWTLTEDNLGELWDEDVIKVHCKPHFAALPEPRWVSADRLISTVVDGLTIAAHRDKPRQIAYFGDRITLDPDGRTYTVHHAAPALEGR